MYSWFYIANWLKSAKTLYRCNKFTLSNGLVLKDDKTTYIDRYLQKMLLRNSESYPKENWCDCSNLVYNG
jgi:hypothetical protein